ncbi:MAG: SLBB domain-containing protein [Chitinophagaceae bacterium]|nr:SLBB domain-containing protein [Chitinophagaceae bacterium]
MKLNPVNRLLTALLLPLFALAPFTNFAQGGNTPLQMGKVSQLSDQQIMQIWQQTQKAGISESDAIKLLVKKGMDPAEVNNFKKRLVQLQGAGKSKFGADNLIKDTTDFIKDSSWVFEVPQLKKKSNYYGYEFFSNPNNNFEPNLRIATPKNYVLGPDDEIILNFTGLNESSVDAKISTEGTVQLPYAGIISLNGLTIEQASQKIKNKMKQAYPALVSGRTQLFVTLSNMKSIRIKVVGEAEHPGNYLISSMAGFFNVLYLANGPSEKGSLRKIELIRNNKVIDVIDFYSFLQKGIMGKEIRLEDQDIIRFPLYQKRVFLSGEVKRPAIFELLEKETLAELLQFGGGLEAAALKDVAKIVQMGDKEMKLRDVVAADFNYFIPRDGDSVFFEKVLPRFTNRVILTGAVYRPGNYELTEQLSLAKLIKKADGLKQDAFTNRGYIKRRNASSERALISFHTGHIVNGKQDDILLVREDSVFILSKDSLQDIPSVTVAGNVRIPGNFQYREGMSVEDIIVMAGGFTNDAATHKIEISRLEKNTGDTLANKLIDLVTLDVDATLSNQSSKTLLQPLDYVFVPRLLNYRNLGSVKIRGEVLYAGDYSLEKRNETIQEVIQRSGGISPFASMADVQVFRKGLRVGTTLLSDFSLQNEKFLLQPDDSIYIPKKQPFVEVKGAVFNPQIVSYQSERFMSYISDVGGITDKGNLKKAYVQYSNGINRKIHHFLFFRTYPKVLPGSKIFVPEKTETASKGLSVFEVSTLLGSLATLVSLIVVLKK